MRTLLLARTSRALTLFGCLPLLFLSGSGPAGAESRVFKCTSASGQVAFSQTGCEQGREESLLIKNPEVGWINLKTVVSKFKAKSGKRRSEGPKRVTAGARPGEGAQKQKCWRAKKKVARIERELKRGYQLARGEELRYQRTEQREYLELFCKTPAP